MGFFLLLIMEHKVRPFVYDPISLRKAACAWSGSTKRGPGCHVHSPQNK